MEFRCDSLGNKIPLHGSHAKLPWDVDGESISWGMVKFKEARDRDSKESKERDIKQALFYSPV